MAAGQSVIEALQHWDDHTLVTVLQVLEDRARAQEEAVRGR